MFDQESATFSFEDVWNSIPDSLSSLYPETPTSSIQEYDGIMFKKPDNIFEKYSKLDVKPFIKSVDLNADEDGTKPKSAWEIGLEFSF